MLFVSCKAEGFVVGYLADPRGEPRELRVEAVDFLYGCEQGVLRQFLHIADIAHYPRYHSKDHLSVTGYQLVMSLTAIFL